MAVSFDLFGTLVSVDSPDDPAAAVADELRERGVPVPADFGDAYREPHVDAPAGAEVPLSTHVEAALSARDVDAPDDAVRRAVAAAFAPDAGAIERRAGALAAIEAAADRGPVGLCSNCSVHGLVDGALRRAELRGEFDAVVTSSDCGWRKPDARAFEALADRLGVEPESVVHVGDDPGTDGGIEAVGGRFVDVADVPLSELADRLESKPEPPARGSEA